MNKGIFVFSAIPCLTLAAGVLLAAAPLAARGATTRTELLTVTAPRVMRRVVGHTIDGGKIEVYSLSRRVSYADLDLALEADVVKLKDRIDAAAQDVCRELGQRYPLIPQHGARCVHNAIKGAMAQAHTAIAAAENG